MIKKKLFGLNIFKYNVTLKLNTSKMVLYLHQNMTNLLAFLVYIVWHHFHMFWFKQNVMLISNLLIYGGWPLKDGLVSLLGFFTARHLYIWAPWTTLLIFNLIVNLKKTCPYTNLYQYLNHVFICTIFAMFTFFIISIVSRPDDTSFVTKRPHLINCSKILAFEFTCITVYNI